MSGETFVVIVPLRGGSKSIPKKNIRGLWGRPLCYWVLKAATDCTTVKDVWISTDSDEIADVVRNLGLGVKIHMRPSKLGGDLTTTEEVVQEWIQSQAIQDSKVIILQATSPKTTSRDIDDAVSVLLDNKADSLLSGTRTHRFFWSEEGVPLNYDPQRRPMRQQWAGTFMENGALYICARTVLLEGKARLHGKVALYTMSDDNSIELDEPSDWDQVEKLTSKQVLS